MSLTQISTAGVKDDAVTAGKIPANAVGSSELADNAVDNAAVASNAAIAGTKISPDFGSQNIVTTGSISGAAGTLTGDLTIPDTIVHAGDTDTKIRFAGADIVTVETGGSERVRVDSAGLKITDKLLHSGDIDTAIRFPAADTVSVETAGSERLRVDSSGRVGIGTTDIRSTLHIGSGTGGGNIPTHELMFGTNNSDITFLSANDSASVDGTIGSWNTVYNHQNSKIVFDKNSGNTGQLLFFTQGGSGITERMRIDHTGKVGINVNPAYQFTVEKAVANDWVSRIYNSNTSSGFGLLVRSDNNTTDQAAFSVYSAGQHRFQVNRSRSLFNASNGSQICSFDSDGIKFGTDSASANALDDYEIGSHTASANALSTGSITTQKYVYVKIGNLVHIQFYITFNSTADSDPVQLSIPFTNSEAHTWCAFSAATNRSSGLSPFIGRFRAGENLMEFRTIVGDASVVYNDVNGYWLIGGGTYRTLL